MSCWILEKVRKKGEVGFLGYALVSPHNATIMKIVIVFLCNFSNKSSKRNGNEELEKLVCRVKTFMKRFIGTSGVVISFNCFLVEYSFCRNSFCLFLSTIFKGSIEIRFKPLTTNLREP